MIYNDFKIKKNPDNQKFTIHGRYGKKKML